jgi:hypothetical protein
MKILLVVLLIAGMGMTYDHQLMVNLKIDGQEHSYSLPYAGGYLYKNKGTLKILLTFYKKDELFKKDTSERLHLYIYGEEQEFKKCEFSRGVKVFFIRVQTRPDYGFFKISSLQLKYNEKKEMDISGNFDSERVLPLRDLQRTLAIAFSALPLKEVKSFTEIYDKDNNFYKKILRENIGKGWQ